MAMGLRRRDSRAFNTLRAPSGNFHRVSRAAAFQDFMTALHAFDLPSYVNSVFHCTYVTRRASPRPEGSERCNLKDVWPRTERPFAIALAHLLFHRAPCHLAHNAAHIATRQTYRFISRGR
ncbi:hypothetical protein VTO73DRAFT_11217 [Trametes versicolor]